MSFSSRISLTFEILSLNVRGISGYKKRRKIFNYLEKHSDKDTIIFFQDTHSVKKNENEWINQWGFSSQFVHFLHNTSNSKGVLTLSRENTDFEIK